MRIEAEYLEDEELYERVVTGEMAAARGELLLATATLKAMLMEPAPGSGRFESLPAFLLGKVESGVLGGQWKIQVPPDGWRSEWQVLRADLSEIAPPGELARLEKIDQEAYRRGERVLYVPTFYAWGRT